MMTLSPVPEPFVNEDLSKLENRTNLALFGLMLIPQVRVWFLERLALPSDSKVYPPKNVSGGRPDFVVVDSTGAVAAWIEVELGAENQAQLMKYRQTLTRPIRSIVGPQDAGGDLSLEEIARVVSDTLTETFDHQQMINAGVFTTLVSQMTGSVQPWDYVDPEEIVRHQPLIQALTVHLGHELRFGTPPIAPGTAQVMTITQRGWTIRVFSKAASMGTVAIIWDQSMGRGRIHIPSRDHLARYLPSAPEAVGDFVSFFASLGLDLTAIAEKQRLAIAEQQLVEAAEPLADR
ncbi:MAG: hypothetical protein AB7U18_05960, partial [Dehalococcoidia bacterium]